MSKRVWTSTPQGGAEAVEAHRTGRGKASGGEESATVEEEELQEGSDQQCKMQQKGPSEEVGEVWI